MIERKSTEFSSVNSNAPLNLFSVTSIRNFAIFYLCFVMTGFVCTNSKGGGEECTTSQNALCYECDSRFDPNCADPFDFSPTATLDPPQPAPTSGLGPQATNPNADGSRQAPATDNATTNLDKSADRPSSQGNTSAANATAIVRQPKKLPPVAVCHGCCVKITSRMVDGGIYVKRTCTTNLQINFFMVGLVCMKESGDRGKMCFCDNDYCNGQQSTISNLPPIIMLLSSAFVALGFYLLGSARVLIGPTASNTKLT